MSTKQSIVWLAVYTYSKHEKKVDRRLQKKNINTFLPLTKVVRKWHDRKKKIDMPLFPNYLFVRIPLIDKFKIFETPGVIKFLGSNSNPSIIKDQEIDLIRKLILGNIETSNFDYKVGSEVVITSGPMKGIKGKLVRKKGKDRIVIHINTLEKNLMLDISPYSVVQV